MNALLDYDSSESEEHESSCPANREITLKTRQSSDLALVQNNNKQMSTNTHAGHGDQLTFLPQNTLGAPKDHYNSSKEDDFFGLASSSEEEDTDINSGNPSLHLKCNLSHHKQPHKELANISKSSCNQDVMDYSKSFKDQPQSSFWQKSTDKQQWSNPERIWKNVSFIGKESPCNPRNLPLIRKNEEIASASSGYSIKRQKTDVDSSRKCNNDFQMKPLAKSCFFVHHKIAPFLQNVNKSRVPKTKLFENNAHEGCINRLKWCTTQYSHLIASVSMDRTVKIWNPFSYVASCLQVFTTHEKAVKDLCWTKSGRQLISCGYDRTARLFDIEKGVELSCFDHRHFVTCIDAHPENPNYFVTGSLNELMCWDQRVPAKPMRQFTYTDSFGQVQDVAFFRDGSQFVTCNDLVSRDSSDRNVMAWDFASGVVLSNQIYQERYTCTRICNHPHDPIFMAQTQGNYIAMFSNIRPYKMNKCKRFDGHKVLGYQIGCDISPDGTLVISGSSDGKAYIYDFRSSRSVQHLNTGNQSVCMDVGWHPVLPSTVALATWDGRLSIWQ